MLFVSVAANAYAKCLGSIVFGGDVTTLPKTVRTSVAWTLASLSEHIDQRDTTAGPSTCWIPRGALPPLVLVYEGSTQRAVAR